MVAKAGQGKCGSLGLAVANYYIQQQSCPTSFPGAQTASLSTPKSPQWLKVSSCSNTGLSLWEDRWQMPLLLFSWQCSWQVKFVVEYIYISEKAMAAHSSTLAWRIPWMEEPGRLQSMGSRGVRHDWAASLSLLTFMHWRRKWQSTPVFLPGESQGRQRLVGCCLWGHTESDTSEAT